VLEQIRARLAAVDGADLVLVAIDGPGRSDRDVAAYLEADVVVRMEDFPRDNRDGLDAQEAYELCFDWGRLVDEVLDPIAVGEVGRYAVAGGEVVEVPARGLVIVDGPFSTRPQLRGYYDLMVWVDAPTPTGRAAEDWYADNVGPPSDALVISAGR
jgi:uridine kinase